MTPSYRLTKLKHPQPGFNATVPALLSHREASWIENAMECWPPALRRRLNAALNEHERAHSRFLPFRSRYFRPGLKYINLLNFRDLGAVNEAKKEISGI